MSKNVKVELVMILVLFCFSIGWSTQEHPTKIAEVKKEAGISKEEVAQAIEEYVAQDVKLRGGYFLVYDQKAKKPLVLKLVRVHKERLSRVADDVYFACADFKTIEGEIYDLDIFMKGTEKDNLKVTEIAIHKEADKPRYTWYEESGIWRRRNL